jgi:hypothetical protein
MASSSDWGERVWAHAEQRWLAGPLLDWMHPSMRDLLITYLMTNVGERRSFLRQCGVDGLELALSAAGGAEGERRFPLLRDVEDWELFEDRLPGLIAAGDERGRRRLLATLAEALATSSVADDKAEDKRLLRLSRNALAGVRDTIAGDHSAVSIPLLTEYVRLSLAMDPLPPLPDLTPTWAALAPSPSDELAQDELADLVAWFRLIKFLTDNEPRLLAKQRFAQRYPAFFKEVLATAQSVLDDVPKIYDTDPFTGVEDDDDDGDFSSDEEDEASLLEEAADALDEVSDSVWATFGLLERKQALVPELREQASVRGERIEVFQARARPDPDDRPSQSRAPVVTSLSERFDVAELFSDL